MISTCPPNYADPKVVSKCAKAFDDLRESNTKLIVPVTNLDTNITYANEYCALCNSDLVYNHWNLTAICSQEFTPLSVPTTYDDSADSSSTNITRDYYWETTEATKYIEFDSITKTFKSKFNNRRYECTYHTVAPSEFDQHLRACVSNVVSGCPANFTAAGDPELDEKCKSYTSVCVSRYQQNILYRNRECALCNGEKTEDFQAICGPIQTTQVDLSTIFTSGIKGS